MFKLISNRNMQINATAKLAKMKEFDNARFGREVDQQVVLGKRKDRYITLEINLALS